MPVIRTSHDLHAAEAVPTQPHNPDPLAFWLESLALDDACLAASSGDVRGENETRGPIAAPIVQDGGKRGIKRNSIRGRFGLYSADTPVDDIEQTR